MPRKAKPPADPKDMPRTEKDLDWLMSAIEQHKLIGNQIGEKLLEGEIDHEQAVDLAALADAELYDINDQIAIEREEEFVAGDEQLRQGLAGGRKTG